MKISGKSAKKITNVDFSKDFKEHCKDVDDSCWEVLEMQQFGTVSGTLRSWRFDCDGEAKTFTSLLGSYEHNWRVLGYSKAFFQKYKNFIQRSKVIEATGKNFMWLLQEFSILVLFLSWFWGKSNNENIHSLENHYIVLRNNCRNAIEKFAGCNP